MSVLQMAKQTLGAMAGMPPRSCTKCPQQLRHQHRQPQWPESWTRRSSAIKVASASVYCVPFHITKKRVAFWSPTGQRRTHREGGGSLWSAVAEGEGSPLGRSSQRQGRGREGSALEENGHASDKSKSKHSGAVREGTGDLEVSVEGVDK